MSQIKVYFALESQRDTRTYVKISGQETITDAIEKLHKQNSESSRHGRSQNSDTGPINATILRLAYSHLTFQAAQTSFMLIFIPIGVSQKKVFAISSKRRLPTSSE